MAAALAAAVASCGGGSSSAPSPTPTPTATTTVTITSSGVSPQTIVVPRGSQATFVNNDSHSHVTESDPHPEHTDCPEINSAGPLSPGQSRQTGNLNTVRSCGYHDHEDAENRSLRGTITIG